jgi:hypothetical protein
LVAVGVGVNVGVGVGVKVFVGVGVGVTGILSISTVNNLTNSTFVVP